MMPGPGPGHARPRAHGLCTRHPPLLSGKTLGITRLPRTFTACAHRGRTCSRFRRLR